MDAYMMPNLHIVLVEKLVAEDQTAVMIHFDGLDLWEHLRLKLHLQKLDVIVGSEGVWMGFALDWGLFDGCFPI